MGQRLHCSVTTAAHLLLRGGRASIEAEDACSHTSAARPTVVVATAEVMAETTHTYSRYVHDTPCDSPPMAWVKIPAEHHPLFHAALPDDPRVETMKMFGGVAAKVNGHIFAGLFGRSTMLLHAAGIQYAFVRGIESDTSVCL